MTNTHEVISAFLDNEPFELQELANALEDPAGRALLVDLAALRDIVQPDEAIPPALSAPATRGSRLRPAMAAAAVLVAMAGGYFVGQTRSTVPVSEAPAPTRVVRAPQAWSVVDNQSIVRGVQ